MFSSLMVLLVIAIAIFIGIQGSRYKKVLSPMIGMMIAMTTAMMASLTIGINLGVNIIKDDPTLATIYAIVIGIIIGYATGFSFGILAQLDGVLAGVMGGLMGPMTGFMISNRNPNLFIGFFNLVFVITMILVYQLIQRFISGSQKSTKNRDWSIFLSLCFILLILAIYQSRTESLLNAEPIQQGLQKNGYQEAIIQVSPEGYSPSNISLKLGIPVKLHFQKKIEGGCLSYLFVHELGIHQELKQGDNVIQFTPKKPGTITYTCGMGMFHGTLTIKG